jgi:hypothetical protein
LCPGRHRQPYLWYQSLSHQATVEIGYAADWVAADWSSFIEKSALRADSFLARLSDDDFQQGTVQPPLSMQIRALERELGTALFERTSRRVTLTEAGTLFRVEAERTLQQAIRAKEVAQRAARGEVGTVRVDEEPVETRLFQAPDSGSPGTIRSAEHAQPPHSQVSSAGRVRISSLAPSSLSVARGGS